MKLYRILTIVALTIGTTVSLRANEAVTGFTNTPQIPGQPWKVHDATRPMAPVIDPGATASQPPSDAKVLFDGKDLSQWVDKKGQPAAWTVQDGYVEVKPGKGEMITRDKFGDCQIHIEWASPKVVEGEGQERGNSGVFLMGRYEIQVLDCYSNRTNADGATASLYGQFPPEVNACRKPGEWQTYDIIFEAPKFAADGSVQSPAYVTVIQNGVVVQNHRAFNGPSGHKSVPKYSKHDPELPISLQDHGDFVRYRNIWVRPLRK